MTTFECFDNFLFLSKVYLILKLLTKFVEVENVFFFFQSYMLPCSELSFLSINSYLHTLFENLKGVISQESHV